MKKKSLKLVCVILLVLSPSCAKMKIKDAEWCADMGSLGATCVNTLSEGSRDIEKAKWDEERFGQVCTQPENFAEWKATILKFCSKYRVCSYEFKKKLESVDQKLEALKK